MRSKTEIVDNTTERLDELLAELTDYDYVTFVKEYWRKGESMSQMEMTITGHLYIEDRINMILSIIFKNDDNFKNFEFSEKIAVIKATGIFPVQTLNAASALGALRNKFAHDLKYKVQPKDLQRIHVEFKEAEWSTNHLFAIGDAISFLCGAIELCVVIASEFKKEGHIVL